MELPAGWNAFPGAAGAAAGVLKKSYLGAMGKSIPWPYINAAVYSMLKLQRQSGNY